MTLLKVVQSDGPDFEGCWRALRDELGLEGRLRDRQRSEQVRQIIDQVRAGGDSATAELTAKYDNVRFESGSDFRVSAEQMQAAHRKMDSRLLGPLRRAVENVRIYQSAIKSDKSFEFSAGSARLGIRYRPLRRVGVIVPGASAPLVSTVIMTVVPAQVAGVEQVVVVSPPSCCGDIHPAILGLCCELGVTEVYRIGGAQAVAAMAFGTETIGKVEKIVGPSNWWGQIAKKEVYGLVDIDSFAGPSEVLILADDTANAAWVAADMLSQAEHDPGSALLITDSANLATAVAKQIDTQLKQLTRAERTVGCIERFCLAVVTETLDRAIGLADEFAAEHLQIQCRDSSAVAERIQNAGAIFVGHNTPVAVGDYFAGPSHTLPTGGSARYFSPLSVNDFIKHSSVICYDGESLSDAAADIEAIAAAEGLDAHGRSVRLRLEGK